MLTLLLALLSSPAFAADTLDCAVERKGEPAPLIFSAPIVDKQAIAATAGQNELKIGLDATLSPTSFFLVLQDELRQTRASFSGSALASAAEPTRLGTGDSRVTCRKKTESLSLEMPAVPALPDYLVCVLDELKFVRGSAVSSRRIARKVVPTLLFGLPHTIEGMGESIGFRVKYHRADYMRGLDVTLLDGATGAVARYVGPSASMGASFLLGLTQGNRETAAEFHRLGCIFSDDSDTLN